MADLGELVRLLNELEEDMVCCTRCGMCQAVCPLYAETGRETDVARGKLVLLENLSKKILDDPEAVKKRLDRCLLCGSCSAACPSGVPILNIFLKARTIITGYLGLSPLKKTVFRGFLANPERFDRLLQWMGRLQGPFSKKVNESLDSSCGRFISPLIGNRHYPPIASSPWHQNLRGNSGSVPDPRLRVAFYPGCLVDKLMPRVADAAMKVLAHHRVDVFVAEQVPCCGMPALAAGEQQTFEKLLRQNLRLLDAASFDYLLTPCATCTSTIKKLWPLMCGHMPDAVQKEVAALSGKTRDITEFLVDTLALDPPETGAPGEKTVTWHDPCHLRKSLGVYVQPRRLLQSLEGLQFVEMREADRCCGMGGSFNLEHYDLSRRIGQKKLLRIQESGADVVATGCPACMLQITDLLSHAGSHTQVRHPVELYAEALESRAESPVAAGRDKLPL
ncbi:MAG TPA: (Fe-S)-binding protein [Desulfosalsimonadaceae bacterium]|nr:(Fe-S)-binding protein [Desulfosalsimonadaceae bacterium]